MCRIVDIKGRGEIFRYLGDEVASCFDRKYAKPNECKGDDRGNEHACFMAHEKGYDRILYMMNIRGGHHVAKV